MGLVAWFVRCVPGLSILTLLSIILCALGDPRRWLGWSGERYGGGKGNGYRGGPTQPHEPPDTLASSQLFFVFYTVLVHLLALAFPVRLCYAVWQLTREVKSVIAQYGSTYRQSGIRSLTRTLGSPGASLSHIETARGYSSSRSSSSSGETRIRSDSLGMAVHAILLPNYKEDIDTLRETLEVLASHAQARISYDIYLAMEEKDPDGQKTAFSLMNSFPKAFRSIQFTVHPTGVTGESQGKSSNISWAARQATRNYVDEKARRNCIITVMDADTHLSSNYFALVTKMHFRHYRTAETTLYVAPIIFDRNAHIVPALVRVADILWCGAGLSGLYKNSAICIPTSVYSVSLLLAERVGGWDTGPEAIGEDLHMYLKCYFATAGNLTIKVVHSPASQCNVSSDAKGYRGWIESAQARYRQALRHMWGALDTGYAIEKAWHMYWRKDNTMMVDWPPASDRNDVPSPYDDSEDSTYSSTAPSITSTHQVQAHIPPPTYDSVNLLVLFHRLFEAHFLPTHLTILLASSTLYTLTTPATQIHPTLLWAFDFTSTLRFLGIICMMTFFRLYESYHHTCVSAREAEMRRAGLYEQMQGGFTHRHWRWTILDYVIFPFAGTFFGSIPAIVAEMSHFYTDRLTYRVSKKPQLMPRVVRGRGRDPKRVDDRDGDGDGDDEDGWEDSGVEV